MKMGHLKTCDEMGVFRALPVLILETSLIYHTGGPNHQGTFKLTNKAQNHVGAKTARGGSHG